MSEIIDESLRQLDEPDAEKAQKKVRIDRSVAEAFVDGLVDGSVDPASIPEKDMPAWYDAATTKYDFWRQKAQELERRVPTLEAEPDQGATKVKPDFGRPGKRSRDMIREEAVYELSDTSERDAKAFRDAERVAEAVLDSIEDGSVNLADIPEKDIPAYHRVVMKQANGWQEAIKKLENRLKGSGDEQVDRRKAA